MKILALDVGLVSLAFVLLGAQPEAQRPAAAGGVPRELALAGMTVPTPGPLSGGQGGAASLTMFPACAKAIEDTGGPGCLHASSVPELGKLYPLSANLFVDAATGNVGIGTTTPNARLRVMGTVSIAGNAALASASMVDQLTFLGRDGIQFPEVDFGGAMPMITMFDAGVTSLDRMVIGHSPAFPNYGLEYQDSSDTFRFRTTTAPTFEIDMGTSVTSDVPFTATSGTTNVPVITATGTAATYAQMLDFTRTTAAGSANDLLQLAVAAGSSASAQYIECQTGLDIDFRVDGDGEVFTDVGVTTPADFAEMIEVTTGAESVEPGDVVVIDAARSRAVVRSTRPYSTLVAGVYSTKPGVLGTEREWDAPAPQGSPEALAGERIALKRPDMARLYDEVPVAVVGIVPCKVSTENGPIQPGDLLVSSSTPGHAMRADAPSVGTVLGKALEPLANGTGRIRILVTLQ